MIAQYTTFIRVVLGVNVIWDFLSWYCMMNRSAYSEPPNPSNNNNNNNNNSSGGTGDVAHPVNEFIARMHTDLWLHQNDSNNRAACSLMAWWVLTLGFMRLCGVFNEIYFPICGISYAIEGYCFACEVASGRMRRSKAMPAAASCVAIWAMVVAASWMVS